jgi:hypothetical protein
MPGAGAMTGRTRDETINLRASEARKHLLTEPRTRSAEEGRISCWKQRAARQRPYCWISDTLACPPKTLNVTGAASSTSAAGSAVSGAPPSAP